MATDFALNDNRFPRMNLVLLQKTEQKIFQIKMEYNFLNKTYAKENKI